MQEGTYTLGVMRSTRTVGSGVGSHVYSAERRATLVCRARIGGPWPSCRCTALSQDITAREALAACNVPRYSES